MPIFWGCKSIDCFFDEDGIIKINNINDKFDRDRHIVKYLNDILDIVENKYNNTIQEMYNNFHFAKLYVCAEDWIYENYPFLF